MNITEKVHDEPSSVSTSPTLCLKLKFYQHLHLNVSYHFHISWKEVHTIGPSSGFGIRVQICIEFLYSVFVQFVSLHLEPRASPNLVCTLRSPAAGRAVYGLQVAQALFNSPWASAKSYPCFKTIVDDPSVAQNILWTHLMGLYRWCWGQKMDRTLMSYFILLVIWTWEMHLSYIVCRYVGQFH